MCLLSFFLLFYHSTPLFQFPRPSDSSPLGCSTCHIITIQFFCPSPLAIPGKSLSFSWAFSFVMPPSDCHGFQNPPGFTGRVCRVRVRVGLCWPLLNPWPITSMMCQLIASTSRSPPFTTHFTLPVPTATINGNDGSTTWCWGRWGRPAGGWQHHLQAAAAGAKEEDGDTTCSCRWLYCQWWQQTMWRGGLYLPVVLFPPFSTQWWGADLPVVS